MSNLITRPYYANVAFRELMLDVKETPGAGSNQRILHYFDVTGLSPSRGDETHWCAAGINFCMFVDGIEGTGKANARSFMDWGHGIVEPQRGAIAILWRESRQSWKGHVGITLGWDSSTVTLLSGNTGDTWTIKPFSIERVIGWRLATEDMRYT
jgi:uncharacterized protein (TIGR02594 family)